MEVWNAERDVERLRAASGSRALRELGARLALDPDAAWEWIARLQDSRAPALGSEAVRKRGAVQTPWPVARLMAERVLSALPSLGSVRLLDAGCGSGRLLAAAAQVGRERRQRLACLGLEIDAASARWAQALEPIVRAGAGGALAEWRVRHADFLLSRQEEPRFDAVLANPPWVAMRQLEPAYRQRLRSRLGRAASGDLSALFVDRLLDLVRPGGRLCVIVPNKLLAAGYAAPLRERLLAETCLEEIWDLSSEQVFRGCGTYPVILVARREVPDRTHCVQLRARDGNLEAEWPQLALASLPDRVLPLGLAPEALDLALRLFSGPRLGGAVKVGCGIAVAGFGRAVGAGRERILCSGDVGAFQVRKARPFSPERAGVRPASLVRQRVPKIVLPGMFRRLCAAYDAEGLLLGRVYFVPLDGAGARQRETRRVLLLALLNSRLYSVLYAGLFAGVAQAGGYLRLNAPYLRCMPWPTREVPRQLAAAVHALERGAGAAARVRLDVLVESGLFGLSREDRARIGRLERGLPSVVPSGRRRGQSRATRARGTSRNDISSP